MYILALHRTGKAPHESPPSEALNAVTRDPLLRLTRAETQPFGGEIRSQGRGELLVSLCHQPAANRLTVVVLKARNLPKMDITGLSDPYVKIYLLYNGQRVAKKKTHVKKRTLNPVFNESFVFDLPAGVVGLESISLEFLLLDWDRVTKNEVIGRLELGGSRATACGSANHHWSEVVTSRAVRSRNGTSFESKVETKGGVSLSRRGRRVRRAVGYVCCIPDSSFTAVCFSPSLHLSKVLPQNHFAKQISPRLCEIRCKCIQLRIIIVQ
nr:synaptotagmin-7-like [Penaeus vannamei]